MKKFMQKIAVVLVLGILITNIAGTHASAAAIGIGTYDNTDFSSTKFYCVRVTKISKKSITFY